MGTQRGFSDFDGDVLEPETILRMSKQLLQVITFSHMVSYAHGGKGYSYCT